jgi:hypothetical protein
VAQYRAGDWPGATAALEKAIALHGRNSYDEFFLAMARWQSGERSEASRLYDQAVPWMEKHKPRDEELRRFHSEAAKLLGIGNPARSGKEKEPP